MRRGSDILRPTSSDLPRSGPTTCEAGGRGPTGVDPDLAIACTFARRRGIALAGPVPAAVFGDVPRTAYLDAIFDDLHWILAGGIVQSPYYGVLNVCRSAFVLLGDADVPPSKEEGATWGLTHLPAQHHAVIGQALACYRSAATIDDAQRRHHGHTWDDEALLRFAAWARNALGALPGTG